MTASAAKSGFGLTFAYESATDTWTSLGEVVSCAPPVKSRGTIQVTHMGSDDGYHEYIADLKEGGDFSISTNHTLAGSLLQDTLFEAGSERFKITLSDGRTCTFTGIPTESGVDEVMIDDKMAAMFSGKVSGKPVWANPA